MINSNFITYDIPKSNPLQNDEVEKKFFSESVDFFIAMRFLSSSDPSLILCASNPVFRHRTIAALSYQKKTNTN